MLSPLQMLFDIFYLLAGSDFESMSRPWFCLNCRTSLSSDCQQIRHDSYSSSTENVYSTIERVPTARYDREALSSPHAPESLVSGDLKVLLAVLIDN